MPASRHMALRDAVVARLLVSPALAGGNVKAGTRRPMPQAVNAQIHVELDESTASGAAVGPASTEWATRIRVECIARETATDADDSADALMVGVHDRLMAEPTFSGAALDTRPLGIAWRPDDEAETGLAVCQALFQIRHRTARASIAAP